MAWVYTYLAIGIVVSLAMVSGLNKQREQLSTIMFMVAVICVIALWPLFLYLSYRDLCRRRQGKAQ